MKKVPSSTLADDTYTFQPADLIKLLHDTWLHGHISGLGDCCGDDGDPLPTDQGGPQTTAWILKQDENLKNLKRRKDGTVYQALKKPKAK